MKTIMVMFDSLRLDMLKPYGCDWTHTPNFERLARNSVTFDNCYVGSMPCMPARREIHTGRYNFLHRSWGPVEPFDDSMPEILKENGIYTHLVSDHYHYWEEGGCNYHTKYNTWEMTRGQEGDPWKGVVKDPQIPEAIVARDDKHWRQDWINRTYMREEIDHPQAKTFSKGIEFLEKNKDTDNWFLQIETFDPHEPFFSYEKYKSLYPHEYTGPHFDWPPYEKVKETAGQVEHVRYEYAALLSMCDCYLGKVLDIMDRHNLWKDTMLIINTDHGYLLGEHGWWAKGRTPMYSEIAKIPLFIWDPRSGKKNTRIDSLVQTIDIAPTILEYFGIRIPKDMQGKPLKDTIASNAKVREAALFGYFGSYINCTDGRYVYMRAPEKNNSPLYEYTLMPTHMKHTFSTEELQNIELTEPFSFAKGCRTLKIPVEKKAKAVKWGTLLYDLLNDPKQQSAIEDEEISDIMKDHMLRLMNESDAPAEQYIRMGLGR